MRFLLFLVLSSVSLLAQEAPTSSDKYVWAESGLVLRSEGNTRGEKLAVIPFGAIVQLTGEWGEDLSIEIISERELDGEELPEWKMLGQFVGIRYGALEGFAFNGYISNYDPVDFPVDSLGLFWLSKTIVDTLVFLNYSHDHEYGEVSLLYPNGITSSSYWDKAGGGGAIVIPNANLATGYLLAVKLFGLDQHYSDLYPRENPHLFAKTEDSLTFRHEQMEVTIKEYFGVVIIIYDAHC